MVGLSVICLFDYVCFRVLLLVLIVCLLVITLAWCFWVVVCLVAIGLVCTAVCLCFAFA